LDYIANNFSFPLVIKPTYGSSSAYVVKVENKEELINTYNYLKKNISTEVESALADGVEILVEEYIDGDEVDIDILLQNGKVKFYSITDNDRTNEPFFVETGQSIPTKLPAQYQQDLIDLAEETLEKMGVQNGCIHFEAKSTKNGAVPIEVNLRMGGDEVYSFVKGAWGVDLIENAVKIALGVHLKKIYKPPTPKKYITGKYFLTDNSGILVQLEVPEDIKKSSNLEEVHFFKEIGDAVLMPPEGYDFLGWLTVSGYNPIDAQDNLREIMRRVKYEVAKFGTDSSMGKTSRKSRFSSAVLNKNLLARAAKIEKIKRVSKENQPTLHIGLLGSSYEETQDPFDQELSSTAEEVKKALKSKGYKVTFFDINNFPKVINDLKKSDVDLVFNIGEKFNQSTLLKPHIASLLDVLQIPYTGSSPYTLSLSQDKIKFKKLLNYHGIPTAKWDYAYKVDDEINEELRYPLIVKPANGDNSFGITNESVVINKEQLAEQLKKVIVELGRPALVEEYIQGDEYDVSILGSDPDDLEVLPLSRAIFKNLPQNLWQIYTYDAKWSNSPVYQEIVIQRPPKNISKKVETLITEIALDTYNILDCQDYGRVEIRVDNDNNPYVLELNANPHLGPNACLPAVAKLLGTEYADLLVKIITLAIRRYQQKPNILINE
jgi:D-alanine-D-alanine ligase